MDTKSRILLAITGASGTPFAKALLNRLIIEPAVEQIILLSSPVGRKCLKNETGHLIEELACASGKIHLLSENDLEADISSGSSLHRGMAIVPCSAGTLGRIASGTSDSLITRAADVCLKERRPLILCVRETPLNRIHIENMLKAHDSGATIMPLAPAFYHNPNTIEELCDTFAVRTLDQLGFFQEDHRRWRGSK
jgi:4-hydroxy-3-polyprenylbenzoate decarboxylase